MATKEKNKSEFAQFLTDVFDSCYSRNDWAYLLRVSTAAISQWCNDKTIPNPENLRAILGYLKDKNEKLLIKKFDEIKYKKIASITANNPKFKIEGTLSDYLLNIHFGKLFYEINESRQGLKETYLNSFPSIVYNSASMSLDDVHVNDFVNEIDSISKSLKYRVASLGENGPRLFTKLINEIRGLNEWLRDTRPIPDESKFWSQSEIEYSLKEDSSGVLELFNIGQKKLEGNQGSLPTIRIYAIDSRYYIQDAIQIDDLLEMIMIIPFSGEYSVSNLGSVVTTPVKDCSTISVIQTSKGGSILPKLELKFKTFAGYIILFSPAGVLDFYNMQSQFRYRKNQKETIRIIRGKNRLNEMLSLINPREKGIKSSVHESNREQGILKTYKESEDLFILSTDSELPKWKFSLIEIKYPKKETRINDLYKHDGLEIFIPLNEGQFKSIKCGLKSSEIDESKINKSRIDDKDIYHDIYCIEKESSSLYRPIVIFDPNIPHAFQSINKGLSSKCLHIYLQPNVKRVLNENENLDDFWVRRDHDSITTNTGNNEKVKK